MKYRICAALRNISHPLQPLRWGFYTIMSQPAHFRGYSAIRLYFSSIKVIKSLLWAIIYNFVDFFWYGSGMLWVAGRNIGYKHRGIIIVPAWELIGIYSSERKAVAACSELTDFVGPVPINMIIEKEFVYWKDSYYPLEGRHGKR